ELNTYAPIATALDIGTVAEPSGVQLLPSADVYASNRLPLRVSLSEFGVGKSRAATNFGRMPAWSRCQRSAPSFTAPMLPVGRAERAGRRRPRRRPVVAGVGGDAVEDVRRQARDPWNALRPADAAGGDYGGAARRPVERHVREIARRCRRRRMRHAPRVGRRQR